MSQSGILSVEGSDPQIPTIFITDSGNAIPVANEIEMLGDMSQGVSSSGSGNTVTYTVADATTATKGVAFFDASQFSVIGGFVSLTGGGLAIDEVALDAGTSPIVPNGSGQISLLGGITTAGSFPLKTNGTGTNTATIEAQLSQALAAADSSKVGLSNFDSSVFTVDADGFVSLVGGGAAIDQVALDAGTSPIVPNGSGQISLLATTVAAGTVPIQTNGTGANTATIEAQISQAIASTDATKIGLSNFDSAAFDVDANGFVQLNGGGIAATSFNVDANTGPGTDPVVPDANGLVNVTGGTSLAGTTPVQTNSLAANTYTIQVQISQALAAADATKIGLCNFDSSQFSVDADGFVTLVGGGFTWNDVSGAFSPVENNGYIATATATGTLPASPSQGDTIKFFVDHASQDLTIQAAGSQLIRIGSVVSSAGGTAVSTLQGDSVTLVYRASDDQWFATSVIGTWVIS